MRLSESLGRNVALAALLVSCAIPACSDDDSSGNGGSAGSAGSSGATGGGASGSGGKGGSAGSSSNTGGTAGTAGTTGSGGTTGGTAGSAGSGGATGGTGNTGGAPSCESPIPEAAAAGGEGGMNGEGGGGGDTGEPLPPTVIATFDEPGSLSTSLGSWQVTTNNPVPDSFVRRNPDEGRSCPGALELTVPFTAYGTQTDAQINFNPVQDWTGRAKLHAWVKIPDPGTGNLNHVGGVNLAVLSENYGNYDNAYEGAATFADFDWHEIVLDLTAGDPPPDLPTVIQIHVQLQVHGTAPEDGPEAPVPTVMLVDDIWLE